MRESMNHRVIRCGEVASIGQEVVCDVDIQPSMCMGQFVGDIIPADTRSYSSIQTPCLEYSSTGVSCDMSDFTNFYFFISSSSSFPPSPPVE